MKITNLIKKFFTPTDLKNRKVDRDDVIRWNILRKCKEGDYGICPPPMDATTAINELFNFFFGDDVYIAMPICQTQCNTEIVYLIESAYTGDRERYLKMKEEYLKAYGAVQEHKE